MNNAGLVLRHEINIELPFRIFERNFKDFVEKHKQECYAAYSINTDGKFRAELKLNADDNKEYILRISGWKLGKALQLQKLYVNSTEESIYLVLNGAEQHETRPMPLYSFAIDLLNLLEVWAIDHKGIFCFEYVDCKIGVFDVYNIIKGLYKEVYFNEEQLKDILDQIRFEN